jgi:hypothetical protein
MSSHRRSAIALVVGAALAMIVASASAGLVSSLGVAKRTIAGKQSSIVVDRRGDAVYELGGESLPNLKCVTSQCLKVWTPVLVRSAGVKGNGIKSFGGTWHVVKAG